MTNQKIERALKYLAPGYLGQIIDARKAFSNISIQPWRDACSKHKRAALRRSRISILPPSVKRSLRFVVDVGANEGQWIGSLIDLLPVSEVWIFEPNPEAMKICQGRIGKGPGIRYFDVALGDDYTDTNLHVTSGSDFSSVLQPRTEFMAKNYGDAARVVRSIPVRLRPLDSLVPNSRTVDLLKIDVQGFERAVLCGARRVLARTRCILIETNLYSHYVGDDIFPALWSVLVNEGFSFWSLSSPHLGWQGKALWADAVFVRPQSVVGLPLEGGRSTTFERVEKL